LSDYFVGPIVATSGVKFLDFFAWRKFPFFLESQKILNATEEDLRQIGIALAIRTNAVQWPRRREVSGRRRVM
jgi:hypothetical protein